jgi:hypothetical protein
MDVNHPVVAEGAEHSAGAIADVAFAVARAGGTVIMRGNKASPPASGAFAVVLAAHHAEVHVAETVTDVAGGHAVRGCAGLESQLLVARHVGGDHLPPVFAPGQLQGPAIHFRLRRGDLAFFAIVVSRRQIDHPNGLVALVGGEELLAQIGVHLRLGDDTASRGRVDRLRLALLEDGQARDQGEDGQGNYMMAPGHRQERTLTLLPLVPEVASLSSALGS